MITIAIIINDRNFSNVNVNSVMYGNPGIGGTPYEFLLLSKCLSLEKNIDLTVFHVGDNIFPKDIKCIRRKNISECFQEIKHGSFDYAVLQNNLLSTNELSTISLSSRIVIWAHNFPSILDVLAMKKNKNIHKIVCVGKKFSLFYRLLTKKVCLIENMVSPESPIKHFYQKRKFCITYVGSLTPGKSFHCLAKTWPKLSRLYPELELNVIGTGKLYNQFQKLGDYGIAEPNYEKRFVRYLLDKDGRISNRIHFLGDLGLEKYEIMAKSMIGVVNPTGRTETFGLGAIEFNRCGVFVIGSTPSIVNNVNGWKTTKGFGLFRLIKKAINKREKIIMMGESSARVVSKYLPNQVVPKWKSILK